MEKTNRIENVKRKVRVYRYICDECGWEAIRAEIMPVDMCSKCGNTNPPLISTETKEFEHSELVKKAAEYVKRLLDGEDPEDISSEKTMDIMSNFRMLCSGLVGNFYTLSEIDQKGLPRNPLVY